MPRFKKVYIEITNVCNLSCNFCPKTNRASKFMNVEEFRHILKSIKPYTEHIYFHLMGEPLLNPNLERFLELSEEEGFKVNITTNATLISRVKDVLLNAKALRQLNISLHSFEANDQGVDFEKYIADILAFVNEASEKTKIISALRLWNLDTEGLKANNEMNVDIFKILEENFDLDYNLKERIEIDKKAKLKNRVYLNTAEKFQWPDIKIEPISETGFCYGLRDQLGILSNGVVVPCCLDSEGNIPLGNIFETSLYDILESKRAKDIYEGFSRRCVVEELCKRCGYRTSFN